MGDDREKFEPDLNTREKFAAPADEGDEVEGHKYEPDLEKREKFASPTDDGDDVEAHKV
jgi:hypothetical protein